MLRAYGRFVQSLNGRYYTACDVGTFSPDMDLIGRECDYVTGRTVEHGGAGDSSVLTAFGVYQGMRASAQHVWGDSSLGGRTIGVAGVGKVGKHLTRHLLDEGAHVVITDPWAPAVEAMTADHPELRVVDDVDAMVREPLDIYAPCALGGALDDEVVEVLQAKIVCGAANNQLAHDGIEKRLEERGIVYAPDYCVNAGGVMQVADELDPSGFDFDRAKSQATQDLRHDARGAHARRRAGRARRRSPPTGWPSSACATWVACARCTCPDAPHHGGSDASEVASSEPEGSDLSVLRGTLSWPLGPRARGRDTARGSGLPIRHGARAAGC